MKNPGQEALGIPFEARSHDYMKDELEAMIDIAKCLDGVEDAEKKKSIQHALHSWYGYKYMRAMNTFAMATDTMSDVFEAMGPVKQKDGSMQLTRKTITESLKKGVNHPVNTGHRFKDDYKEATEAAAQIKALEETVASARSANDEAATKEAEEALATRVKFVMSNSITGYPMYPAYSAVVAGVNQEKYLETSSEELVNRLMSEFGKEKSHAEMDDATYAEVCRREMNCRHPGLRARALGASSLLAFLPVLDCPHAHLACPWHRSSASSWQTNRAQTTGTKTPVSSKTSRSAQRRR